MSQDPVLLRRDVRDAEIRQAREQRQADDTRIAQKVMAVNREAFIVKFPGMLEHSMRLVNERLMNCLSKPEGIALDDPTTWPATADDIFALSTALKNLNEVHSQWRVEIKTNQQL